MNIDKSVIIVFLMYYFYRYGIPLEISNYFYKLYIDSFHLFLIHSKIYYSNDSNSDIELLQQNKSTDKNIEEYQQKKYEDKYIEDIRRVNKEWKFTEDEEKLIFELKHNFFNEYLENSTERIEYITKEIVGIEKEIIEDNNYVKCLEDFDDNEDQIVNETLEEKRNKIKKLQEENNYIKEKFETEKGLTDLMIKSQERSRRNIIDNRIDKLKNCYVMEKTPIGNVLMIYDKEHSKFRYYSDSSIPYRYLEVVGRKYVKSFNCRPIFVDMEEELKLFEEKWDKEQILKKERDEEKLKMEETKNLQNTEIKKKNVFAKFKSYNNEIGIKGSMVPPKNSSNLNKNVIEQKENEKVLIKENANCYIYDGKLSNFNFLKNVEKKVFNKKLGFTFADFKKIKKQ
jgi:uncharacterized protein YfcZ (UPF0381/DUF406 family)